MKALARAVASLAIGQISHALPSHAMRLGIATRVVFASSRARGRPGLLQPPRTKHGRIQPTIIRLDAQTTTRVVAHALQHHTTKRLVTDHPPRSSAATRAILTTHPHPLRKPRAVLGRPTTLTPLRTTHRITMPGSTIRITGTTLTISAHGTDGQGDGLSLPTAATSCTLAAHRKVPPRHRPGIRLQDATLSDLRCVRRTDPGFTGQQQ